MNNSIVEIQELYDECQLPKSDDLRWYLVAVVGTSLSLISLFTNLLIALTLLTRRRKHFFFLGLLSVSDIFLSFCYGPVIAMDVIKNRVQVIYNYFPIILFFFYF